jgi:CheY-like chemotaxis protein
MLVGLSILVAEDNPINQKVVRNTLAKQGADVTIVENGRLAVESLRAGREHYDAILMDLQMPEMDGYEATRLIRNELNSNIPIIAMTADALKGEDERTTAAGMTGFVSKPFEPADLYQKILALTTTGRVSSPGLVPVVEEGTAESVSTAAPVPAAPLPAGREPLVDLSYLTDLSGDDPAYLRDVVGIFLGSVPQSLEHLQKLVEDGSNRDAIRKTAHSLKSSFGVIQVNGFLERLAQIETLASGPNGQEDMQRLVSSLTDDFQQAMEELQAMMGTA